MNRVLTAEENRYISYLGEVQVNIGKRIAPFLFMPVDELKNGIHPAFGLPNWMVYVLLCECAGVTYIDLAEALR